MAVLHKINPKLHQAMVDAALPLETIETRAKPWFGNSNFNTLLQIGLDDAVRGADDTTRNSLIVDGKVMAHTIMRGALQETLMKELPAATARRVQFGKTLCNIRGSPTDMDGIEIGFTDGTSESSFDLVVGCDGIKTAVKEFIETGSISRDAKGRKGSPAVYSGIRVRYAVQDLDAKSGTSQLPTRAQLRQYFGDGGYALTGVYGAGPNRPPTKCAFTIFLDPDYIGPFKRRDGKAVDDQLKSTGRSGKVIPDSPEENVSWKQDDRKDIKDEMLRQIDQFGIPDVETKPIIKGSDRFFELGVYFHLPFTLSGWSKEVKGSGGRYCTLCGDAAHAMPPFLGQGSNQAIQDSFCLAETIAEYNSGRTSKPLSELLKEYENLRWAATTEISAKAAFLGYVEAGPGLVSKFRDTLFFTLGKIGLAKKIFLGAATPKVDR